MTIEDSSAPQSQGAADSPLGDDLRAILQTLALQTKAADERSAELEERLALLEGGRREDANATGDEEQAQQGMDGFGFKRVSFKLKKVRSSAPPPWPQLDDPAGGDQSGDDAGVVSNHAASTSRSASNLSSDMPGDEDAGPRSVVAIPEFDVEGPLVERIMQIEQRLDEQDGEKIALDELKYGLPESTFTFLITHGPLSVPFAFAVFSMFLSISCLSLTLASSIQQGSEGNRLGIPAGVTAPVRVAQFLGAIVGVLMEDEIPQGLQLIANGAGHTLLLDGKKPVHKRVVVSSIFRLVVGYLFLSSLFINVAQNSDVISIFYDVLALEFVENIDDTTFVLAKKGFFGRSLLVAANQHYSLEMAGMRMERMNRREVMARSTTSMVERRLSFSGLIASNNRVNRVVRFIYFLNAAFVLGGLAAISSTQKHGHYRCNSINVVFDEEVWERAIIALPNGDTDERLLIYSTFNGIYREQGSVEGYPKYVEQNKNDGSGFGPNSNVTSAEIRYCHDIGSWVFTHPKIIVQNECSWLWRSHQTEDFDILSTTYSSWEAWTGKVTLSQVSIRCKECSEDSDCNYHGICEDKMCLCDEEHYGISCEFSMPCKSLASEKAQSLDKWEQEKPINLWGSNQTSFYEVYNRPVYIQKGLSGEPYDMRLYRIREKEKTLSPSSQPSMVPSVSIVPTSTHPTTSPTRMPSSSPTSAPTTSRSPSRTPSPSPLEDITTPTTPDPTMGSTPTVGMEIGMKNTPFPTESFFSEQAPLSAPPTVPLHKQNDYDTAPDFADWDDFFESPTLHDLEEILDDFSVVISYSGSRFYGTIIERNSDIEDLFPSDYHAFWSQSFDENRTFIISDTTFDGSPVGIDFFEMRRRVDTALRNKNVNFSYGPFGALIPLMDYKGTGFFHCLDVTSNPSSSPSSLSV